MKKNTVSDHTRPGPSRRSPSVEITEVEDDDAHPVRRPAPRNPNSIIEPVNGEDDEESEEESEEDELG